MPVNCKFLLARQSPIFYNGEIIEGSVSLQVTGRKPIKFEGIKVILLGKAEVAWCEYQIKLAHIEHNDSTATHTKINKLNYTNTKTYVNEVQTLSGAIELTAQTNLPLQNFHFKLPMNAAASCRLPHAEINYALIVALERKRKHTKLFTQKLNIRNRIELESFDLNLPKFITGNTLNLATTRCAYVPGQSVSYQLSLGNTACYYPAQYSVRLCQSVSYIANQPRPKVKRVTRVLASQQQQLQGKLRLPLITNIMTVYSNNIIQISYYLEALSLTNTTEQLESLCLPLYVGTVALRTAIAEPYDWLADEREHCCFVNLGNSFTQMETKNRSSVHSCASKENVLFNCNDRKNLL